MEKYRNFSLFIILIPTPDLPHFYYMLGGNLGSLLYVDITVMGLFYTYLFELNILVVVCIFCMYFIKSKKYAKIRN